jgi:hypothetical protein
MPTLWSFSSRFTGSLTCIRKFGLADDVTGGFFTLKKSNK